mmetsp:Transcript_28246/g.39281  ORF Transcript_28246/g.39281 Transcript_28246/m.39281 type:complete len:556 (+) Transcript_28246:359-2026(+)|eukprot:CAMPEP_0184503220 /NCGR_PEP_ID=MMETSP0113_2-20130426/51760_1 /TAXON_ID=91329 /ORGANISM="Norrisiella sphaerica, Strain BC52" /LENGTH=555 /DNA_ID=CAMNT_0026892671 /DNA_START=638 /DNA_END=2305 /DNA_ORIENTATION=-
MRHGSSGARKILLFSINDVYITDHLAKFRSLIDETVRREKPDAFYITHQGDFLSPSPLSNFDKGANMVEALNAVGVTHICLGNHEFDVSLNDLKTRLGELKKAKVVTTNIHFPGDKTGDKKVETKGNRVKFPTVEYDITDVCEDLKIGWLGLCTEETVDMLKTGGMYAKYEGLYFSNYLETARRKIKELKRKGVDFIVLLTHLSMHEDRLLAKEAKKFGIPIILGGHDHDEYFEDVDGVKVIKAGVDARKAAVTSIEFASDRTKPPIVTAEIVSVMDRRADSEYEYIQEISRRGEEQLKKLGGSLLIKPTKRPKAMLSSKNARNGLCTVGKLFAGKVRRYFGADACIVNSGKIRNDRDYPEGMTLVDVQSELPFRDNFIYVVEMTGQEIEDTLICSYRDKLGTGGFLQYDKGLEFDQKSMKLIMVAGGVPKMEKAYTVVMPIALLNGLDNIAPLKKVGMRYGTKKISLDNLMLLQDVVTKMCIMKRWAEMNVHLKDFQYADKDEDGRLSHQEFEAFIKERLSCAYEAVRNNNMENFCQNLRKELLTLTHSSLPPA